MGHWYLDLQPRAPITVASAARVLGEVVEGPVETTVGELAGNPRDYYARTITVSARSPVEALVVEVDFTETTRGEGDPEASIAAGIVTLRDAPEAPFAMKLAVYRRLREAFGALGCRDVALPPTDLVDDAEAAGELALGAELRAQSTAMLLAAAQASRDSVTLIAPRFAHPDDLETILAAYPEPTAVRHVTLWGTNVAQLPRNLARFPHLTSLSLGEPRLDPAVLATLALPAVTHASFALDRLTHLARADLAGFPALVRLSVSGPLADLADDLPRACPRLCQISIGGTPLAKSRARIVALQRAWPQVHTWELRGLFE